MIYGIIADMHGNLEALRAALEAIDARAVDRIVCLGDVVGYNAESNACVDLLERRGIATIAGNHDLIAIHRLGLDRCADKPAFTLKRTRKDLTPKSRTYLAGLPSHLVLEDGVVLIHGGVNDPQEYVTTPSRVAANAVRLQREVPGATICFFGHTHEPKLYAVAGGVAAERPATGRQVLNEPDTTYFINPGSIDGSRKEAPRFAEFVIFDASAPSVEFHQVAYDFEAVERAATAGGYRMTPADVRRYRIRRRVLNVRRGVVRRLGRLFGRGASADA